MTACFALAMAACLTGCGLESESRGDGCGPLCGLAEGGESTGGDESEEEATTMADPSAGDAADESSGGGMGSTGQPDDEPPDSFCPGGLVREPLDEGSAAGTVTGGSFLPGVGWRTSSKSDRIVWDLGAPVRSGVMSFEVTGIHADVGGCTQGVCYYVGLFEEQSGDKLGDYTGSAFIESRFHTNDQENFHDVFKLQAGTGNGDMLEPLTPPMGWSAEQTHSIRIEWGPDPSDPSRGRAWLYLDDAEAPLNYQAFYDDPEIGWRYLFLGTTAYKGLDWGMVDVTYRDLCLVEA